MDRSDIDHESCARLLSAASEPLLVPAPVLVEVDWLAGSRLGARAFVALLADIDRNALAIVDLVRSDYERVRQLLSQYADLSLRFVDAAVLAIVERFGERKLATLDHRHFAALRPRHVDSLLLLPE